MFPGTLLPAQVVPMYLLLVRERTIIKVVFKCVASNMIILDT